MHQQLRTPEHLGSPGLPSGLTEATLADQRVPSSSIGTAVQDAADAAEDVRPVSLQTQAINFLSTLRTRLPDGCVARVTYSETLDDDEKIQGQHRPTFVFGCTLPDRKFICASSSDGTASHWRAVASLVQQASDAIEFATFKKARSA